MNRRTLLRLAGMASAPGTAVLAGCAGDEDEEVGEDDGAAGADDESGADTDGTGTTDGGDDTDEETEPEEPPVTEYAPWLRFDDEADEPGLTFVYADMEQFGQLSVDLGEVDDDGTDYPLFAAPLGATLVFGAITPAYLSRTGLRGLLEEDGGGPGDGSFETTIETALFVNGTVVLFGEIDPQEVDDQLSDPPVDDETVVSFAGAGTVGGYSLFEPAGEADDDPALDVLYAVDDDALLLQLDGQRDGLETVVSDGTEDSAVAPSDREHLEWMLEMAGEGGVVSGFYGDRTINDIADETVDEGFSVLLFEGTVGSVSSLTVESEDRVTAKYTVVFDEELPDWFLFDAQEILGPPPTQFSIDVTEDDEVAVDWLWTEDDLRFLSTVL